MVHLGWGSRFLHILEAASVQEEGAAEREHDVRRLTVKRLMWVFGALINGGAGLYESSDTAHVADQAGRPKRRGHCRPLP